MRLRSNTHQNLNFHDLLYREYSDSYLRDLLGCHGRQLNFDLLSNDQNQERVRMWRDRKYDVRFQYGLFQPNNRHGQDCQLLHRGFDSHRRFDDQTFDDMYLDCKHCMFWLRVDRLHDDKGFDIVPGLCSFPSNHH